MRVEYNDDREVLNKSTSGNTQYPIVEAWVSHLSFSSFDFNPSKIDFMSEATLSAKSNIQSQVWRGSSTNISGHS